jgi:hypothetical protein
MEGELYSHDNVWFGCREPQWWEEDEEEFDDRILQKNNQKRIRIIRRKK